MPTNAELQRRAENRLLGTLLELAVIVAQTGARIVPRVEPPVLLKPFLGFNAKVPSEAMRAARRCLEIDEEFRDRVALAASEELVGEAGVLFVTRTEGWESAFSELVGLEMDNARGGVDPKLEKKLKVATDALAKRDESLVAAREEIASLKATLLVERRERSSASKSATDASSVLAGWQAKSARLEHEVDALREQLATVVKQLDAATGEIHALRAAEEKRGSQDEAIAQAIRAVEALRSAFVPKSAGESAAVGSSTVGSTIGERNTQGLKPGSLARSSARIPVAPVSSRGLVTKDGSSKDGFATDTVTKGVVTKAAELRAAPIARPRDRPANVSLPGGVFDDSVEAAHHLLRLQNVRVLIDGYNVAKLRWGNEVTPGLLRERLIAMVLQLAQRTGAQMTLVFDGVQSTPSTESLRYGVNVEFTPEDEEADDRILSLATQQRKGKPLVVVSSDNRVVDGARALGVRAISAEMFIEAAGSSGAPRR
jgi:predicted RNA-binding protein with PIN domain